MQHFLTHCIVSASGAWPIWRRQCNLHLMHLCTSSCSLEAADQYKSMSIVTEQCQRGGVHLRQCIAAMMEKPVAQQLTKLFRWEWAARNMPHNAIIMFLVAVPPVCTTYILRHVCSFVPLTVTPCNLYFQPLKLLNLLWFLHVDVTFYIISLIQVCSHCSCIMLTDVGAA